MAHCCPSPICDGPGGNNGGNPQLLATCFILPPSKKPEGGIITIIPPRTIGDKKDIKPNVPSIQIFSEPTGGPEPICCCIIDPNNTWTQEAPYVDPTTGQTCIKNHLKWTQDCTKVTEAGDCDKANQGAIGTFYSTLKQVVSGPNYKAGSLSYGGTAGKDCKSGAGAKAACDGLCEDLWIEWEECEYPPESGCECYTDPGAVIPDPVCEEPSEGEYGSGETTERCCVCTQQVPQVCHEVVRKGEPDPTLETIKSNAKAGAGGCGTYKEGTLVVSNDNAECKGGNPPPSCPQNYCSNVTLQWVECEASIGEPLSARSGSYSDFTVEQRALKDALDFTNKLIPAEDITQQRVGNLPYFGISPISEVISKTYLPGRNVPVVEGSSEITVLKPEKVVSYGNNTPEQISLAPTKEEAELTIVPSELTKPDPANKLFSEGTVLEVAVDDSILKYAHNTATLSKGLDSNNIFASTGPKWLVDLLSTSGGVVFKEYNGTTIGANLFQTQIFEDTFSKETSNYLNEINNLNNSSLYLKEYLVEGIKRAINNGKLGEYSPILFQKIIKESRSSFPTGTPRLNSSEEKKELAYQLLRQKRVSIDPSQTPGDGDLQRQRQMYQVLLPQEIQVKVPIVTQSGETTYISVHKEGLHITFRDGTIATPPLKNEFLQIPTQAGGTDYIGAASLRNIAYIYDTPTINKVFGLLSSDTQETKLQESYVELTASTVYAENTEEELISSKTYPQYSLWTVIPSSITELSPLDEYVKTFSTQYELVWSSISGGEEQFNTTVAEKSGPRESYSIPYTDAITDHMFVVDADDGKYYLTLESSYLNIPLDGNVYPSPILTDFMVCLVNNVEYNPFQGESELTSFIAGEPVKRTVRLITNPLPANPEVTQYVTPIKSPTGKGVEGKVDEYAFIYKKNLGEEVATSIIGSSPVFSDTERVSILGTVLSLIKDIDSKYELTTPSLGLGKMLPQLDLFSFLTVNQVINFFRFVPLETRKSIFSGEIGGVKIFNPLKEQRFGEISEKTFITSSRQKGVASLESQQLYTKIPQNLKYYNSIISETFNI